MVVLTLTVLRSGVQVSRFKHGASGLECCSLCRRDSSSCRCGLRHCLTPSSAVPSPTVPGSATHGTGQREARGVRCVVSKALVSCCETELDHALSFSLTPSVNSQHLARVGPVDVEAGFRPIQLSSTLVDSGRQFTGPLLLQRQRILRPTPS